MKPSTKQVWGQADRAMIQTIRKWMDEADTRITTEEVATAIGSSYSRTHNVLHMRNNPFTISQFIKICSLFNKNPTTEFFKIMKEGEEAEAIQEPLSEQEYETLGQFMDEVADASRKYLESIKSADRTPPPGEKELVKAGPE